DGSYDSATGAFTPTNGATLSGGTYTTSSGQVLTGGKYVSITHSGTATWSGGGLAGGGVMIGSSAGQGYVAGSVTGRTYASPSGVTYMGGTATGGTWSPDVSGSSPWTPVLPTNGTYYANQPGDSGTPDWNQMATDAQKMMDLVYGSGGGTVDSLQQALAIELKYSQYIRADWNVLERVISETQAYANGTATSGQLGDLFWLLGSHNSGALLWMAQNNSGFVPGEVWVD